MPQTFSPLDLLGYLKRQVVNLYLHTESNSQFSLITEIRENPKLEGIEVLRMTRSKRNMELVLCFYFFVCKRLVTTLLIALTCMFVFPDGFKN